MLIRLFSDLHTEFAPFEISPLDTDSDTVCVLAGDIGVVNDIDPLIAVLQAACSRFKAVIYVFGNHEFYRYGSINRAHEKLNERLAHHFLSNLYILENSKVIIDGVAFIGATLWTDFDRSPYAKVVAAQSMNDYRQIRCGTRSDPYANKLTTTYLETLHEQSKRYVFDHVVIEKAAGHKVVVVVHHGVSDLSVGERYRGDPLNPAFVSDLSNHILDTQPQLICHGHVHTARDYTLDDTRVVVNPRGYPGERTEFNPTLVIEV